LQLQRGKHEDCLPLLFCTEFREGQAAFNQSIACLIIQAPVKESRVTLMENSIRKSSEGKHRSSRASFRMGIHRSPLKAGRNLKWRQFCHYPCLKVHSSIQLLRISRTFRIVICLPWRMGLSNGSIS